MSARARVVHGRHDWRGASRLPRHRHREAYAALVLAGGYEESGSRGRFRVCAGQVLLHRMFDAHLNGFVAGGARILNLPLLRQPSFGLGAVGDPDYIVRLAESDLPAATEALLAQVRPLKPRPADWPDLLAQELCGSATLSLQEWADRHGLAPATVSRGFRRVFATSPARFRAESRAQQALALIGRGTDSLAAIAARAGYADQAHMTRAVTGLTGRAPGYWFRSNRFKTGSAAAGYNGA